MLTLVDYDGLFLYTHIVFLTAGHDSGVFQASQVYKKIESASTDYKIIGDSAFAASDYMIRSSEAIGSRC